MSIGVHSHAAASSSVACHLAFLIYFAERLLLLLFTVLTSSHYIFCLQAEKEVKYSKDGGIKENEKKCGEHQLASGACDEVRKVHSWLQDYSQDPPQRKGMCVMILENE